MDTIGQRIYALRVDRTPKLTQAELAERAGISVDMIQKLEQGRRTSARITTLTAIATALDVDLAALVGRPTRLEAVPDGGGLLELRRALTPVTAPGPTSDVTGELSEAWGLYWAGDYDRLAAILPGTITAAAGDQSAEAHSLAASVLVHLGHCDLALLALRTADEVVSDEVLAVELAWTRAWVLLCQGRPGDGAELATRLLDDMTLTRRTSPQRVSAWGVLAVTGATAAARAGDGDQAAELLRAARAAVVMDGREAAVWPAGHGSWFGPTKVVMMEVDCAVVSGDHASALRAARHMPPREALPLASWARHRTDVAWAASQLGRRADAERTLLELAGVAPQWLQYQAFPRAVLADLLPGRRVSSSLQDLARVLRVDGTERAEYI